MPLCLRYMGSGPAEGGSQQERFGSSWGELVGSPQRIWIHYGVTVGQPAPVQTMRPWMAGATGLVA